MPKSTSKPDSVRALQRGLAILHHVNSAGQAGPGDIARALNIPRSSVYRLLATLEQAGYISSSASSNRVRVTRLAASLGDGYGRVSALCQAAAPVFADFSPRLVWPLDLSVYDNGAMVVQETTHARSPLSVDQGMLGQRLPLLRSSAGRAYLAFCDEAQRDLILTHLRRINDPDDAPLLDPPHLERTLSQTRARGLAMRRGDTYRPHTASLAAPILSQGRVRGCASVIWIRSAMSMTDALAAYGEPLKTIAAQIADRMDR